MKTSLFFASLALFSSLSLAAINVPVEVTNWSDIVRSGEPVTAGVPLPIGAVTDLSRLRITDGSGNAVPAQFKAISSWWREKNMGLTQTPSAKWVLCDFQAPSVPATGRTAFTLKDDNTSGVPATTLAVTQDASSITVVTGPLKFIVSKANFNLFNGVWLDVNTNGLFEAGEQIVAASAANGGAITSGTWAAQGCVAGTPHTGQQRAPERVIIEEQGPEKVLIRIEGRHYAATGGATKGLYGYQVFITAYAGKPYIDVQWAVTNTYMEGDKPELGTTPWTAFSWPFTAYQLNLGLSVTATSYALLGATEAAGTASATVARLLQSPGSYTITGAAGGTDAKGGAMLTSGTLGLMVALRDFAPNNPQAISVTNQQLSLELFPTSTTAYWLDPFTRKNHRMRFEFFSGAYSSGALTSLWKKTDAPLRMLASQSWYRSTNAWERGFGIPPATAWNRKTSSAWTRYAKSSATSNWTNYAEVGEFNGTGDHWNLTSCFWQHVLTGNPADFESAEAAVFNFNDMVPIQTGRNRWTDLGYWALPEGHLSGLTQLHNPEETGYQSVISSYMGSHTWHRSNVPDAGHMPNKQELEYYLLTGDPATKDAIESEGVRAITHIFYRTYGPYSGWPYSLGGGRKVVLDSFYVMPYGPRYISRPGLVALHAYETTGDSNYLYPARVAITAMRNYAKRNPIGYIAAANDALYADTAVANAVWRTAHPGVNPPSFFSGSDFQIGIASQALYHFWEQTGDEEFRDAIIFSSKSYQWRIGYAAGKYTGFTYGGWADYLDDGKRYTDVGIGGSFTSSASEGFGGLVFGYLASGRNELWKVIADGLSAVYAGGANGYDVNCFSPTGNCLEMKLINMWQAAWKHDSTDVVPPSPIADLAGVLQPGVGVRLTWTAPGDDGNTGTAGEYQIKYAVAPIVDSITRWNTAQQKGWPDLRTPLPYSDTALINRSDSYRNTQEAAFWAATNTSGEPVPKVAGTAENFLVTGLKGNTTYYFALVTFDKSGNASGLSNVIQVNTTDIEKKPGKGREFSLMCNRPNPFNPATVIGYCIPERMEQGMSILSLKVFDLSGRLVRTLVSGKALSGYRTVSWNGTNDAGVSVGSGIYVYRLTADGIVKEQRMALVK